MPTLEPQPRYDDIQRQRRATQRLIDRCIALLEDLGDEPGL